MDISNAIFLIILSLHYNMTHLFIAYDNSADIYAMPIISSLRHQSRPDWELVIVTDQTRRDDMLYKSIADLGDERISLIECDNPHPDQDRSYKLAWEHCSDKINTERVTFTTTTTYYAPDYCEYVEAAFYAASEAIDDTSFPCAGIKVVSCAYLSERYKYDPMTMMIREDDGCIEWGSITHHTFAVDVSVLEDIGGWPKETDEFGTQWLRLLPHDRIWSYDNVLVVI